MSSALSPAGRPAFTGDLDLASERLGGSVLHANDDFFAAKENLLKPEKAVFLEHEYTDRGKWMDGWESRRRRVPGHDDAIVRLGQAGIVSGVVVDTAFFRGNYPDACSIEGCFARGDASVATLLSDATEWVQILPPSKLEGDRENFFDVDDARAFSHLRLRIYPDGGVARFRVHGRVLPDWRSLGGTLGTVDLSAVESGALVLACSDMFFGPKHNLIMPGRARNMGDGWETRRSRGGDHERHDWVVVELAGEGTVSRVEVDTNHFKGNYPDTCALEACVVGEGEAFDPSTAAWRTLLPRTKLEAHTRHFFVEELAPLGDVTHLRLKVYPDGGVSRLRVHGALSRRGRLAQGLRRLNALSDGGASRAVTNLLGAKKFVDAMLAARPFASPDRVLEAMESAEATLAHDDWLEAFGHHPRIGESRAKVLQSGVAAAWSSAEQAGMADAGADVAGELREAQEAYEARYGFIFIVCATGKSAAEMLGLVRARMANDRAAEIDVAAAEQRKITRLRLEKLLLP